MSTTLSAETPPTDHLPSIGPLQEADQLLRALVASSSLIRPASVEEAIKGRLRLIMDLLGMPTAFISELTPDTLQVLETVNDGSCGIPAGAYVLEQTACLYVKTNGAPVVIPDLTADPRTSAMPTATEAGMRCYVGVPLSNPDGSLFGTLCALDTRPRALTAAQISFLQLIAHEIGFMLDRERLLRQANAAAASAANDSRATRQVADAQKQVLRVVAHDLRTPLTAIRGYSDLLLEGIVGELDDAQQQSVRVIKRAGDHLNRLVGDLVDAAEVEAPMFVLAPERYDAVELGREVLATCAQRAREAGLELVLEAPITPLPIFGDRARTMQAIINLMSNAIAYTQKGAVTLRVSAADEAVRFAVVDTGPGIPAEAQTRIWEAHQRGTTKGAGLGLGLHIVSQIARRMGGSVGLESAPGAGSTFWIELPVAGIPAQRVAWE